MIITSEVYLEGEKISRDARSLSFAFLSLFGADYLDYKARKSGNDNTRDVFLSFFVSIFFGS
jgi:hypothetical protein